MEVHDGFSLRVIFPRVKHLILTLCKLVFLPTGAGGALLLFGVFGSMTGTVNGQVNLTPFAPPGWSDKIVVSCTTGTSADSTELTTADTLHVDWAVKNNGPDATAAQFYTEIYVDGVLKESWYADPPLDVSHYTAASDYNIGSLTAGSHTIRVKTDSTGVISESDETDNEYTKTINVAIPKGTIRIDPLTLSFSDASESPVFAMPSVVPALQSQSASSARSGVTNWAIRLRSGEVSTEKQDNPAIAASLLAQAPDKNSHVLVQFNRIPSASEQTALEQKGLRLLRYIPNMAYWVAVSPAGRNLLSALSEGDGVRWSRTSSAIDKVDPAAKAQQLPAYAFSEAVTVEIHVLFFSDVSKEEGTAAIESQQAEVLEWLTPHLARTVISPTRKATLAALDVVEWVQRAPGPKKTCNAVAAQRIHVTEMRTTPYNLTGAGVTAGIWDEGAVFAHGDFDTRLTIGDGGTVVSAHSTHVAGTVGGSGAGNTSAMGMAPEITLRSYNWDDDMAEMRAGAANGIWLSNHSYGVTTGWYLDGAWVNEGADGFGYYGTIASAWDAVVYDTGLVVFKAAGNDRNDGPDWPAGPRIDGPYDCIPEDGTGKNIITIGATTDGDGMTSFSSWGPTDDGRVKPDLCANGESLLSTGTSNNQYAYSSGTSMATPSACGAGALLHQLHKQISGGPLRADTLKALMIHGATDLGRTGPDYEFGWGLIHAQRSAELLKNQSYRQGAVTNLGVQTYQIDVPSGISVLKVTLVWTDPAGSPGATEALVNNLDLVITSPSSTVAQPWILDPLNPTNAATQGVNTRDNVEQVVVNNPAAGQWTLSVQGASVPQWAPQAYTIVCEQLPSGIFTIYNDGAATLSVTNITLDQVASYITWSPVAPFSVAPGENRVVTVSVNFGSSPTGQTTRRILVESDDLDMSPYPEGVNIVVNKTPLYVTFDGQGGTAPIPSSMIVTNGLTYGTLATTTRAGYTFAGWWTEVNGGGDVVTAATTVTITTAQTLYAKWTLLTYPVDYVAVSATSGTAPASQVKTNDVTLTLRTNTGNLVRTGYSFGAWNTASNGSGRSYTEGGAYTNNAAATLYSTWILDLYAITHFGPQVTRVSKPYWPLTFQSVSNNAYVIQVAPTVTGAWLTVSESFVAVSNRTQVLVRMLESMPQAFYRVSTSTALVP